MALRDSTAGFRESRNSIGCTSGVAAAARVLPTNQNERPDRMPPAMHNRLLDPEKIIESSAQLQRRITERFPKSGLSQVARELNVIARESALRAVEFDRPNIPLRLAIAVLVFAILAFLAISILSAGHTEKLLEDLLNFVQFLEAAIGGMVFIGAAILYLVNLESRLKLARALDAIRELRALAHIVDMHQLTKDPERLLYGPSTPSSPHRVMTPFELNRYLDYCIELLAVTGKIAALYVQNFPDHDALAAVEQVETLTTGLSRNIWQKMVILGQVPVVSSDPQGARSSLEVPADLLENSGDGV